VTVAAAGYFVVSRGSSASGTPQDFVHVAQRLAREARSVPTAAKRVQRFLELHAFDQSASDVITQMERDVYRMHQLASGASGSAKPIADQAAAAADQLLSAVARYQKAVAFTYRLGNASTAEQDLNAAVDTLNQQAKAWAHQ
jgi:uncharacterized membrane protein YdfJ with MMPL/SSD domain